ncbi:MAG TPA: MoxR family ATPase [Planctomycetota bacterium]|nr:MoxR family ATPase [Planctomycetota bacterium]
MSEPLPADPRERAERFRARFTALRDEVGKVIVGNRPVVDAVLACLFTGGNCLLEGVPGLGKTLLVKTLAQCLSLEFRRIQFTPDLMPADVVGTTVLAEEAGRRDLRFQQGPIFANIVLADEVNRATPKTQSALLEAMQEHSVTVGGTTHRLHGPFFVIATQNPIEMEGTYPLPEAQLDRFLYKVIVGYARREELNEVLGRTTGVKVADLKPVMDGAEVEAWKRFVREVAVASHVSDYATRLVLASHPGGQFAPEAVTRFVRYGASPRAAQALVLGAKVTALVDGRYNVGFRDVAAVAPLALRHRLILGFEAEADGWDAEKVVAAILEATPQKDLLHAE